MRWVGPCLALLCAGCEKVPLSDVGASFALADATWFAEEDTLFFFYRVEARQGLEPKTAVEVSYLTDDVEVPWTPISQLTPVHTHLPIDCGRNTLCGSASVRVVGPPRGVRMRLRYHPEGELNVEAGLRLNLLGAGPAHSNRSLLVYGVFDRGNARVQWRARHQFPTLRNPEVEALGLRRTFRVDEPTYLDVPAVIDGNPYAYGLAPTCEGTPLGFEPHQTSERAVFEPRALPLAASTSSAVCGRATVTDAKGTFTTAAIARKNPEVRAAFPALRSPIRENLRVGFVLRPCARVISEVHLAMQRQRLLLEGAEEICVDDFAAPGFADALAGRLRARIDLARVQGRDMVLTLAVHHDDASGVLVDKLEQALSVLLPFERDKSSPRVSGAFVLDSLAHTIVRPEVKRLVTWCRGVVDVDDPLQMLDPRSQDCAVLPDVPTLQLGPFTFGSIPILPLREQYLRFLEKFSEAQAGRVTSLTFVAPERTPLSSNVEVGAYGVVTFFNNEILTAEPTDAFSYCVLPEHLWKDPERDSVRAQREVAYRTEGSPEPQPLSTLPDVHAVMPAPRYALGMVWDFPYLSRMSYELQLAGNAKAFSLTVPFGISTGGTEYFPKNRLWEDAEIPLDSPQSLLQCTRFCDHATFDSNGVYNALSGFRAAYPHACYLPRFPVPEDGGFPSDP